MIEPILKALPIKRNRRFRLIKKWREFKAAVAYSWANDPY